MIDTSDIGLSKEVHSAEQARDRRIKVAMDLKKKYHTQYFNSESSIEDGEHKGDPSNFV